MMRYQASLGRFRGVSHENLLRSHGGLPMRTKVLIAAAGLAGLAALPGAAQAQPWGGYGFYRPGPPPFWHHPRPFLPPPPPFYRPRVLFAPPPVVYEPPPPPPVYYAPRVYHAAPVYVRPRGVVDGRRRR